MNFEASQAKKSRIVCLHCDRMPISWLLRYKLQHTDFNKTFYLICCILCVCVCVCVCVCGQLRPVLMTLWQACSAADFSAQLLMWRTANASLCRIRSVCVFVCGQVCVCCGSYWVLGPLHRGIMIKSVADETGTLLFRRGLNWTSPRCFSSGPIHTGFDLD